MNKYLFAFILLFSPLVNSGGLQASFNGSSLPGPRSSQIFRFDGTTDGSGNLIDTSGENLQINSRTMSSWGINQNVSWTADAYRNPIDNLLDADVVVETAAGNTSYYSTNVGAPLTIGRTYTYSVIARAINRRWILIFDSAGANGAYFDLQNGVVGTELAGVNGYIQKVKPGWYRCWITKVTNNTGYMSILVTEADNDITMTGIAGQQSVALYGAQITDNTDGFIVGPGVLKYTTTVIKPRLDLAPTGAPPSIESHLQGSDGNRMKARSFDGTSRVYTHTDHDSLDINDSDHTYTFAAKRGTAGTANPSLYEKGAYTTAGMLLQYGGATIDAYYSKGGSAKVVPGLAFPTGQYHIVQVVRSNNVATVYVDGSPGTPTDVSTYGIDNVNTAFLGSSNGGTFFWADEILYASLDNRALSATALAQDRQQIQGILAGHKGRTSW